MRVYLCEKPSQASDIAAVLAEGGAVQKRTGYLEVGNETAVTWCIGHLYRLADPHEYEERYRRWTLDHLPIVPTQWQLFPRDRGYRQISVIRGLLKRADEVVISTDPDREGEVIGREVLEQLRWKKRVSRLRLSALDPSSVRKGLAAIVDGKETESLYHAGVGRARADWLIGMNLSRAWTLAGNSCGIPGKLSVGRVQTPTLALVVRRDQEIENFEAREYWVVEALCTHRDASGPEPFRAVWRPEQDEDEPKGGHRCWQESDAIAVAEAISGAIGTVTRAKKKIGRERPPLPFSLSALQQHASSHWRYGAKQTLDLAQSLYEKYKAITYPRTDCRYLPEDQHVEAGEVLRQFIASVSDTGTGELLTRAMEEADTERKSSAWNDSRVTAHHGIIPTSHPVDASGMSEPEQNIHAAIGLHYLLQFLPDHEFESVKLEMMVGKHPLTASGRQSLSLGWRTVVARERSDVLVPWIPEGEEVQISQIDILRKKTKPPVRYTEGTLIKAMCAIASVVEDPEIRKLLREADGIGTEATRAGIIQTLLDREYIESGSGKLHCTDKGRDLIRSLPAEMTDPGQTALMEQKLSEVESGNISLEAWLEEISRFVGAQVKAAMNHGLSGPAPDNGSKEPDSISTGDEVIAKDHGSCPTCGKPLRKRRGKWGVFFGCSGYPDCRYSLKRSSGSESAPEDIRCPECDGPMVEREGKKGTFHGCRRFPDCRGTRPVKTQGGES